MADKNDPVEALREALISFRYRQEHSRIQDQPDYVELFEDDARRLLAMVTVGERMADHMEKCALYFDTAMTCGNDLSDLGIPADTLLAEYRAAKEAK